MFYTINQRLPAFLIDLLPRIPRNPSPIVRIAFQLWETVRITNRVKLGGGGLGQHVQDEFQVGHVIS
jgi:hypothetical protein